MKTLLSVGFFFSFLFISFLFKFDFHLNPNIKTDRFPASLVSETRPTTDEILAKRANEWEMRRQNNRQFEQLQQMNREITLNDLGIKSLSNEVLSAQLREQLPNSSLGNQEGLNRLQSYLNLNNVNQNPYPNYNSGTDYLTTLSKNYQYGQIPSQGESIYYGLPYERRSSEEQYSINSPYYPLEQGSSVIGI